MMPIATSLLSAWRALPQEIRYRPATEQEIEQFEVAYGRIPPDYRTFLLECGGGVVGSEWLDGIEQLSETHAKVRSERAAGAWQDLDGFVIGWYGAGNPIAIGPNGEVSVSDHNFGGKHLMAPSFEILLANGLGNAP